MRWFRLNFDKNWTWGIFSKSNAGNNIKLSKIGTFEPWNYLVASLFYFWLRNFGFFVWQKGTQPLDIYVQTDVLKSWQTWSSSWAVWENWDWGPILSKKSHVFAIIKILKKKCFLQMYKRIYVFYETGWPNAELWRIHNFYWYVNFFHGPF